MAERWNDESIGVVGTGSYAGFTGKDQTFETNTIVGKRASVLDMCLALSYGAPDDQIVRSEMYNYKINLNNVNIRASYLSKEPSRWQLKTHILLQSLHGANHTTL